MLDIITDAARTFRCKKPDKTTNSKTKPMVAAMIAANFLTNCSLPRGGLSVLDAGPIAAM
jgi:hypothetical protein